MCRLIILLHSSHVCCPGVSFPIQGINTIRAGCTNHFTSQTHGPNLPLEPGLQALFEISFIQNHFLARAFFSFEHGLSDSWATRILDLFSRNVLAHMYANVCAMYMFLAFHVAMLFARVGREQIKWRNTTRKSARCVQKGSKS